MWFMFLRLHYWVLFFREVCQGWSYGHGIPERWSCHTDQDRLICPPMLHQVQGSFPDLMHVASWWGLFEYFFFIGLRCANSTVSLSNAWFLSHSENFKTDGINRLSKNLKFIAYKLIASGWFRNPRKNIPWVNRGQTHNEHRIDLSTMICEVRWIPLPAISVIVVTNSEEELELAKGDSLL